MANPMVYGGTQPNSATQPNAAVNSLNPSVIRNRNTFDLTHQVCQTERWADVMPFLVFDTAGNEDFSFTCNVDQRPFSTFVSPLMSTFRKHKGYFCVPRSVIYKELWQQVFVNPKKGEDVVFNDVVATAPYNYFDDLLHYAKNLTSLDGSQTGQNIILANAFVFYAFFFSSYSLFNYLHLPIVKSAIQVVSPDGLIAETVSYDQYFIDVLRDWLDANPDLNFYLKVTFTVDNSSRVSYLPFLVKQTGGVDTVLDSLRKLYDFISSNTLGNSRGELQFQAVDSDSSSAGLVDISSFFGPLNSSSVYSVPLHIYDFSFGADNSRPVNIERIIAYQMCIAQFFTSDDVDDIYTANIWYQNLSGIVSQVEAQASSGLIDNFIWNGIRLRYVPYSGTILRYFLTPTSQSGNLIFSTTWMQYMFNLFVPAHSLRFGDMFNACRTQPLAVGDYTAAVSDNEVSAVDVVKAILTQRYLNDVNATRNTIDGFNKLMYGVSPDDAPIEPKFVAHSVVDIGSDMVVNTAENQGNLVTNMVLHNSQREFNIHLNQESIVLGLTWYDCIQLYANPVSPFTVMVDRLDRFNPFLQNIGDVAVMPWFDPTRIKPSSIFGYLQNDYEYKQEMNYALGGYIDGSLNADKYGLSSWAFIRNTVYDPTEPGPTNRVINSDFIRNQNFEFDRFFKALSPYSYFHFVCSYVNQLMAVRPMEFVSGILFSGVR